jgi:TfoX/Sxy family transcriptional regulator of competence genes
MAYDEGLAQILREALADTPGVSERQMFGGLCFLLNGNMLCGTFRDRGMYRVGPEAEAAALGLPHVRPMQMGGRPMRGIVEADAAAITDEPLRDALLRLALNFAGALPAK